MHNKFWKKQKIQILNPPSDCSCCYGERGHGQTIHEINTI